MESKNAQEYRTANTVYVSITEHNKNADGRILRARSWKITYFEAYNAHQRKTRVGQLLKLHRKIINHCQYGYGIECTFTTDPFPIRMF